MTRRNVGRTVAAGLAARLLAVAAEETKLTPPDGYTIADMGGLKHYMPPRPEEIVMLIYPGMTALDLIGPQQVFGFMMGANVTTVWKTTDPIVSDTGVRIHPDKALKDITGNIDIIVVPGGGAGTIALMNDPAILDFLAEKGRTAKWVTSVCSGSLILGAAGLLRGYKATSHWAVRDVLPTLGATVAPGRVVEDRNRITAGGITSGIDFGLYIAGKLRGDDFGRALELMLEYDPHPPFHSGTPQLAPPAIRDGIKGMYASSVKSALANAETAKARWGKA